jgi:hypothetical protein
VPLGEGDLAGGFVGLPAVDQVGDEGLEPLAVGIVGVMGKLAVAVREMRPGSAW